MDFSVMFLDIESSTSVPENGKILSISALDPLSLESFYQTIGYQEIIPVDLKSMEIHKLSNEEILSSKPLAEVEDNFLNWILTFKKKKVIPCGFNVGSFDMQYIRKEMPRVAKLLGYRSLDLNALIFAEAQRKQTKFSRLKTKLKQTAKERTKDKNSYVYGLGEHNALYDCYVAMYVYELLIS